MANIPDVPQTSVPICLVKNESGRLNGYITESWFRYLVGGGTTGSGPWVLQSNPTLFDVTLQGTETYIPAGTVPNVNAADANTVEVANVDTVLVAGDYAFFFIAHDLDDGGVSVGVSDASGGVAMIASGVTNITFAYTPTVGLVAQTTGGTSPRTVSIYSIALGVP